MEGNAVKMVPLGGYSKDLRERAIEMHVNGYSKTRVAEILGVGRTTIRRWLKQGEHPYLKPHPLELKEKAIALVKAGSSRKEVADLLKISYFTISFWTRGFNQHRYLPQPYSRKLKRKARKLVRLGLSKIEVAAKLNIPYNIVAVWTNDIHNSGAHLSGAAERIISVLIRDGYVFPKNSELSVCRGIREKTQIKFAHVFNTHIVYLENRKNEAIKALLSKNSIQILRANKMHELNLVFGIKERIITKKRPL